MIDDMATSPAAIAQNQLNELRQMELTVDQRIQIGFLAAQIEIGRQLKGIEATLETWPR